MAMQAAHQRDDIDALEEAGSRIEELVHGNANLMARIQGVQEQMTKLLTNVHTHGPNGGPMHSAKPLSNQ